MSSGRHEVICCPAGFCRQSAGWGICHIEYNDAKTEAPMSQRVEDLMRTAKSACKMLRLYAFAVLGLGLQGLAWQLDKEPTTMRTIGIIGWSLMIVGLSGTLFNFSVQLRRAAEAVEQGGNPSGE